MEEGERLIIGIYTEITDFVNLKLLALIFVFQATELAALVSRVTSSKKEVQKQRKEVTSHREELDVSQTELQFTKNKLDEIQKTIAGIVIRDQKYIHTYIF